MPKKPSTALVKLPSALPDVFVDFTGPRNAERPKDTYINALIAIDKLGLDCRYNIFRNEFLISGNVLDTNDVGELSDTTCLALRHIIRMNFGFEPTPSHMQDAAMRACLRRAFHPIKDYLGSLEWDGLPRIEFLLSGYFNAPDTPLNRAISRIVMMASVRRILTPGTKFDYMTVLQSPEGFNKSSAIAALYGADYFTDQSIIGLNSKDVEETLRGMWAQESPELQGIAKADWNKLKASLSRGNDRVRHAYGRNPVNARRTTIPWGTSNDEQYLRALSGENRRFFSIDVLRMIDLDKLLVDRDQLWAEAVAMEATGESIMLPEQFWADARAARLLRTEDDPWEDVLRHIDQEAIEENDDGPSEHYEETATGEKRVSSEMVFTVLDLKSKDRQPYHGQRIARVMKSLGWSGPTLMKINKKAMRGYRRAWDIDDGADEDGEA